ncbi:MAG: Rv2175c family DNA-binding protein [Mycobacteriales bacterium]
MSEPTAWLSFDEAAAQLGMPVSKVKTLVREGSLVAVQRRIPADFIRDGQILKGLTGTLTLLHDSGYSPEEALRWLFTADDTLPGTPVQALAENRGTEVKRRAQALGF